MTWGLGGWWDKAGFGFGKAEFGSGRIWECWVWRWCWGWFGKGWVGLGLGLVCVLSPSSFEDQKGSGDTRRAPNISSPIFQRKREERFPLFLGPCRAGAANPRGQPPWSWGVMTSRPPSPCWGLLHLCCPLPALQGADTKGGTGLTAPRLHPLYTEQNRACV